MTNRIIKSLDCHKIILIFFILKVNFAIFVIALFVIFNESFQKALVDKSVCVINIVHLIIMSAIKNSLFDVYFNRITALFAELLSLVMRTYLTSFALFALIFVFFMFAYLSPFAIFAVRFLLFMRAYLASFALFALIFVFLMFAKIFQIFLCSVFGHILNSVLHF